MLNNNSNNNNNHNNTKPSEPKKPKGKELRNGSEWYGPWDNVVCYLREFMRNFFVFIHFGLNYFFFCCRLYRFVV